MGPNRDPLMYTPDATPMVVGDRGLVIRSYAARVNGQTVYAPSPPSIGPLVRICSRFPRPIGPYW
eukprot:671976-Prorocentrum_minimum.AAC.1